MQLGDAVVVLDATEITRDWHLSGLEYRLLRYLARETALRAVVPRSVFLESTANYGREYAKSRRLLIKAVRDFRRVRLIPLPGLNEKVDYEASLSERLENLGVDVVDPPDASHDAMIRRAVARRPPFDESGSGYRDTLVWLTCVEFAAGGSQVFLVSQDRDFAARGLDSLAPELLDEVAALPGSVTLIRHLGQFLTGLVPWRDVTDPREAAALARDEEVASIFAPWDMFEDPQFTVAELGLPPSSRIREINYYGSGDLERVSYERQPDGADVVTYEFPIEFDVELSLDSDDALAAGMLHGEPSALGTEDVTTVVEMTGRMQIRHDERDSDAPLQVEFIEFTSERAYMPGPRFDDPEQLRLPFAGEGDSGAVAFVDEGADARPGH